jgi:hypothetical protein
LFVYLFLLFVTMQMKVRIGAIGALFHIPFVELVHHSELLRLLSPNDLQLPLTPENCPWEIKASSPRR